jgi:dipeptidyl aminopeptidase/acylaminoacyl peptidase
MKKVFLSIFAILLCHLAFSQSIADYLSAPFPTGLVASPDGKSIAWIFNDNGERNVFFAKSPDFKAQKITQFTGDNGVAIAQLVFSPDSQTLLFIRGNSKNPAGQAANPAQLQENTEFQIHSIQLATGKIQNLGAGSSPLFFPTGEKIAFLNGGAVHIKNLTNPEQPASKLFTARGSASQLSFSPDGQYLAFTSARTDHSFIGLYDVSNHRLTYPESSLDHDTYPSWSPDGKQLAYLRVPNVDAHLPFTALRESNPWSIRVLNLESMQAKEVWRADMGKGSVMVDDIPAVNQRIWWTPGGNIVFPWEKTGFIHLYGLDIASGTIKDLTPGKGFVELVQPSYDSSQLLITSNIGDLERRNILKLDLNSFEIQSLTSPKSIEWSPVGIQDGWAYLASDFDQPAWPMINLGAQSNKLAAELFPKNFPKNLAPSEQLTLTAKDGFKSFAQLVLPKDYDPKKSYPAVIFLHGGSRRQMLMGFNYSQYYSNAYAMQQYFASQGYMALTLNYRSGIGYGIDFREETNYGAGGASEVQDVMAAADYLASRADVDASKIIPWGGSYGGYLTAHALAQAPGKFLTGVDIHGVHNWNKDIPVFAPWYAPEKYPEMAALAFKSSPMNYVKTWKEPVLLIHGDDDRNVLFSESVELAEILRRQGVQVEQLVFPDEIHMFLLQRNWVAAYEASFKFIHNQVNKK